MNFQVSNSFQSFDISVTLGTLRAEPLLSLFFLSGQEKEKEALNKSALTFEVAVAPTLELVIPVYCRQTCFFECEHQLLREADGRN